MAAAAGASISASRCVPVDISARRRARPLLRAYARGMSRRGVSDTLKRRARGRTPPARGLGADVAGEPDRLGRETGVTILLIYSRLWPDPG